MKILLLFTEQDNTIISGLEELLITHGFQLITHQISHTWEEDRELIENLTSASHVFITGKDSDFRTSWCSFVTGYCMGKECGLVLYNKNGITLPRFMTGVIQTSSFDAIKNRLSQWKNQAEKEQARTDILNLNLYMTPYHFIDSVKKNKLDVVRTYIRAGFSPDTRDEKDIPAICLAARGNLNEMVRLLLEKGCDINAVASDRNNNALMDASANGNAELVKILIDHGSDLDIQSKNDQTSLMLAVGIGNDEIVELLYKAGADINIKDVLDMTAVQYARILKNKKIMKIFGIDEA